MKLIQIGKGAARRRGVALIYAVFGSFVVASMVSVMFTMAGVSDRQAAVHNGQARARHLAEGALRVVAKDLQTALANWDEPEMAGTKVVGGQEVEFTVTPIGDQVSRTSATGISNLIQPYELEARARVDGVRARAHRIVNATWTPLFQFAVFYNSDLEIHAGPDMTLRGRVHSNRDMYLGGGSTITLDTNYVHAVGGIYRYSKRNGAAAGGNVDIRRWVADPFSGAEPSEFERMLSRAQLPVSSTSGYDSNFRDGVDLNGDGLFDGPGEYLPFEFGATDLWSPPEGYGGGQGQTVMTGQHGVEEAVTPPVGSIQMYESVEGGSYSYNQRSGEYDYVGPGLGDHDRGYYYENAGLAIVAESNGYGYTVYDADGNDVTLEVGAAVTLSSVPDMRQSNSSSTDVATIEVDMELLAESGYFPENGLIYAAHEDLGTGTDASGLLLTNGAELASALTVVSPSSVYVQGDYNVVNKQGASVIGDAVNLLSNSWDGSKSPGTLPSASETTYNFAMVTGAYETEGGRYSGGLENLPRFHENWSGVPCNIAGSFVNLYDSQYATGDWRYGSDRYRAPIRAWQYDDDFNDLSSLPPFTPMAVEATDIVAW